MFQKNSHTHFQLSSPCPRLGTAGYPSKAPGWRDSSFSGARPPAHPREVGVSERAWLTEGVVMGGAGGGGGAGGAVRC